MGIFHKKQNDNADMAAQFDVNTDASKNQNLSRKENKERQERLLKIQQQKEMIIEQLNGTYKRVLLSDHSELADKILSTTGVIKDSEVSNNSRAVLAVDGLILTYCRELANYANSGDYTGMASCIDEIQALANERGNLTQDYLGNAEYVHARIELMKAEVNRNKVEKKIEDLGKRFQEIKERALTLSPAEQQRAMKQLSDLKEDKGRLLGEVDAFDSTIRIAKNVIAKKETNSVAYPSDFLLEDQMKTYAETTEKDAKMKQAQKMDEKIQGADKTVRENGLSTKDYQESAPETPESIAQNLQNMDF